LINNFLNLASKKTVDNPGAAAQDAFREGADPLGSVRNNVTIDNGRRSPMTYKILCKTRVPTWMRGQVESLLYFNGGQYRLREAIAATIDRYGIPELVETRDGLTVRVTGAPVAETLWAVHEEGAMTRTVGVLVYAREADDAITVLHVGVADDYAQGGAYASEHVLSRLMQQARRIARDTEGVRHFGVAYHHSRLRLATGLSA
jgi:hypothetical protein